MIMSVSKCGYPFCDGHLAKFTSCVDEALYQMSLCGGYASTGDVDFEGHVTMIGIDEALWVDPSDPFGENDGDLYLARGYYLLTEDSVGQINVDRYSQFGEAKMIFDETDEAYAAWASTDDDVDDDECQGHESLAGGSMGVTEFCDGSCRQHEAGR